MLATCFISFAEWIKFGGRLLAAVAAAGWRSIPRRLVIFLFIWLISGLLTLSHWLGFAVDELLFGGYRKIHINKPIFVLGVPRSGTTWLQRVLARDQRLTSLQTWECVFAPSISERYFYCGLAFIFKPLLALVKKLRWSPFGKLDHIHKIALTEPEEDFLLLAPLQACFLLVLLCPNSPHYWRLAYFDSQISARRRRAVMKFYRRCVQKHLYFHGHNKQFLSKNPSFTSLLNSLKQEFSDACLIACVRQPNEAIPSQLSSLLPSLRGLGYVELPREFVDKIIGFLLHNYRVINNKAEQGQLFVVQFEDLCKKLYDVVEQIYSLFDLSMTETFRNTLVELDKKGRNYQSQHNYDLTQFDLNNSELNKKFSPFWPITSTVG